MKLRFSLAGIFMLCFSMLLFLGFTTCCNGAAIKKKIPVGNEYKLVWSDEFNGESLDPNKWQFRQLGPRRDAVNVKETVTLNGIGHLVLTTKRSGKEYHTAMIGTQGKFQTTFGYFECRVKLQSQLGHWSAFWLQSPTLGDPVGDSHKAGTEIDIFEYLRKDGDKIRHNLHWDGYGKDHKKDGAIAQVPGLGEGWHTFGLLWTDKQYVFYVDGKETWRSDKGISHRPEYIILSLEVGKWAGDIAEARLPDSMLVDYVRVYKKDADSREQSSPILRVLTYNIHHGEAMDGKFDYERLAKVINDLSPDIVALQEVDKGTEQASRVDQAALLGKLCNMYYAFGQAMAYQGGQYGEAILSRFEIKKTVVHPLPYGDGQEPRAALEVLIEPANIGSVIFVGTHLCHQSNETRIKQTQCISELFNKDVNVPVIMAGDFNARPDSEPMDVLFSHGWKDVIAPRSKIDYILVRESDTWKVEEVIIVDEPVVSDHDPVLAVLKWQGK